MSTQVLVCVASPSSDESEPQVARLLAACGASHACRSWQHRGIALGVGARVAAASPAAQPRLFVGTDERVVASVGDGLAWDPSWQLGSIHPTQPPCSAPSCAVNPHCRLTSRRFAALIWAQHSRRLVAARDPLGLEPLYYARLSGGAIALCSSSTALLELAGVSRAIDRDFCAESVLSLPHRSGATCFREVFELPRACWLEWHDGTIEMHEYYRIGNARAHVALNDRSRHFGELFRAAVDRSSATTSELAVTLSGGLDSSSVFRVAQARPNTTLTAISAVFPNDPETAEAQYIEAALSGTSVRSLRFEPKLELDLEQSLALAEDPTWLPMLSITIACAHQARVLGAACVLTGELGDFVAGSVSDPVAWLLRHGSWIRAWQELDSCADGKTRTALRFARQWLRLSRRVHDARALRNPLYLAGARLANAIDPTCRRALRIEERLREYWTARTAAEEPNADSYERFFDGLGSSVARASWIVERLCGVRLEHPFCDPELVSWSAGLSFDARWADGRNRVAFRHAMAGIVPEPILRRRDKARFDGPHARCIASVERALDKPKALWPLSEILGIHEEAEVLTTFRSAGLTGRHRTLATLLLAAWLRMHGRLKTTEID